MIRYLLDTNVVSDLVRNPGGRVRDALGTVDGGAAYTSIIVAGELKFGAVKKGSAQLGKRVELILSQLPIAELRPPVDDVYADLRADLERRGSPIGDPDLWIAAQTLHDGSVLVTDNVREFGRVPGLKIENWLRA